MNEQEPKKSRVVNRIWSAELYLKALDFAALAHVDQKIPGKEISYVVHLSSVCMEVMSAIAVSTVEKPDLAIQCALLHDTIEDTKTSREHLSSVFGKEVADGVLALTKNKNLPEQGRMPDSLRRIKEQSKEVWMVKLADRITNLQPPPDYWPREKRTRYRDEARHIHEMLNEASDFLSSRLLTKIEEYGEYCS